MKLTALFTVRRWLRETPSTAAEASVLFIMASFAQPDGTGIHPGVEGLVGLTKFDRSTVIDALNVWEALGAITKTKAGNRRAREADEYKINLDWQPSKVGPDDFCKSRRVRPMKGHKSDSKSQKSDSTGQKSARTTPSEKSLPSEKAITEKTEESAAKTAAPSLPVIAIPDWIPMPEWNEFLKLRRQRKKPLDDRAVELLIKRLCELRDAGTDPKACLEASVRNGWPDLWPLRNGTEGKEQRLGLSRFGRRTAGDHNARTIRNWEAVGFLPRGTYQKIELELLARGTTFANDPEVLAMVKQIGKEMWDPLRGSRE